MKGRTIAASNALSFPGWQIVLGEVAKFGINPNEFFGKTIFTGDARSISDIVKLVLDDKADAGVLRLCAYEQFIERHPEAVGELRVLDRRDNMDVACVHSTDLYPGFTMAVTELAIKKALFLEQNPRILDLCTGSGCIGLAIARRVKDARVTLGDVSPAALRVARQNVGSQRLSGRVKCLTIDVRQPAAPFLGTFDLIVSNPPYVTTAEMETLDPSVRDYEPHLALWGGDDGLDFYRAIVRNFTPALNPGGWLCFEFGMGQDAAVCDLLRRAGYEIAELKKDTADITRAVLARKREEG